MKVEFEFETERDLTPIEGVAVLYAFDPQGERVVYYGTFGDPSTLSAIGLYTVGLDGAKDEFYEGGSAE